MPQHTPPGAFPVLNASTSLTKTKRKDPHVNQDTHLRFKAQMTKFKGYFHRKEKSVAMPAQGGFWKKKQTSDKVIVQQQTNTVGSLLTVSVPITISSTSHYYGNSSPSKPTTSSTSTSIVQQLIILPPLQVYGFMFLSALLLLVIAFAILQIHRTLSILQLAVDGLKYVLVGFTTHSLSAFSFLKSWVF
ncbi:hypothetical protein V8B55DRAFT_1506249 [Mucor lusitanicus]|uniref:Uncharacterized protein n=1 Tax=Mucor lusitanicus CBS 277.49 TaxID=747725 RepID=A0A168Q3H5_MUCCL|nr:hypothetical protein MUCCIDRAFT_105600 [Mucor lusitanicus CBS 277.49]